MNGWDTSFLLGNPIFRRHVSFKEGNSQSCSLNKALFKTYISHAGYRCGVAPRTLELKPSGAPKQGAGPPARG